MIKDRGNIKWSSLMLVDHKEKLKELFSGENDLPRPELDEQKLEEMNLLLDKSIHENTPISIVCYQDKRYHSLQGRVKSYDPVKKELVLITSEGVVNHLQLNAIIELTI